MKKLCLALLLCLIPGLLCAQTQTANQVQSFTTTTSSGNVGLSGTNTQFHTIQWWGFGTLTTCQVKLEQSATGAGGSWSDLIPAQLCTSNGLATIPATPNFVRITVTVLTGGGRVDVRYTGYNSAPIILGSSAGYTTVEDEGIAQTQRTTLNFTGAGVTCTDDGMVTVCDITSGGGSGSFTDLTSGTNSMAAMVVGTGASLNTSGSGTIAATTAAALAANPSDCAASRYAISIVASGNLTCGQVAYTDLSGTPTIYYQTIQDSGGIDVTQAAKVKFTGTAVTSTATAAGVTTVTLTAGAGGSGCTVSGSNNQVVTDDGASGCVSETNLTFNGTSLLVGANTVVPCTNTGAAESVAIANGDGTCTFADPHVSGTVAHDAAGAAVMPVLIGGYASAAAPTNVSADGDAVDVWFLRNGSPVVNLASGGTLITVGQKAMTASLPVVIASDQSAVPVSGTVTVTDGAGALNVIIDSGTTAVTNAGTFVVQENGAALTSLQLIDDTVFTDDTSTHSTGVTKVLGIGAVAAPTDTAVNANDIGMPGMTVNRQLYSSLEAIAGNAVLAGNGASGTGALRVTVANDSTGIIALTTGSAQIGHLEANQSVNVAQINGVTPLMGNGVSGTGAQRVTIANDSTGIISLTTGSAQIGHLEANQSVNMAQVAGTTTVTAGVNGMIAVGGNTANNVAITSNPLLIGCQGVSSENSAVTTARGVQAVCDLVGKQIVLPYANPENFVNGTTAAITDTTSTSTIASAGGSLRNYITQITVSNSHATVGTFVKILDGTTIIWECYAAAVGGGCTATFGTPLRGTAATAINCQPVTTGANVICSASGWKGL